MTQIDEILALERSALDRWIQGDPLGFVALAAEDITYFDPFQPRRVDGLKPFRSLMESIRGQVRADSYELRDPMLRGEGELALLSFNYVARLGDGSESRWQSSEAYRRGDEGWRLVHSHWSPCR